MAACNTCREPISGAGYLMAEQPGEYCSTDCRNAQITPFAGKPKQATKQSQFTCGYVWQ